MSKLTSKFEYSNAFHLSNDYSKDLIKNIYKDIKEQSNRLDPVGRPGTYFEDYSLCIIQDFKEDYLTSLVYQYNVNNFIV